MQTSKWMGAYVTTHGADAGPVDVSHRPEETIRSVLSGYAAVAAFLVVLVVAADLAHAQPAPVTAPSIATVSELLTRENQAVLSKGKAPESLISRVVANSPGIAKPQPIVVTVNAVYGTGDLLKADLNVNTQPMTVSVGSVLNKCLVTSIVGKCVRMDMVKTANAMPMSPKAGKPVKALPVKAAPSKVVAVSSPNICPVETCWVGAPYAASSRNAADASGGPGLPPGSPRPMAPLPPGGIPPAAASMEVVQGPPPANSSSAGN